MKGPQRDIFPRIWSWEVIEWVQQSGRELRHVKVYLVVVEGMMREEGSPSLLVCSQIDLIIIVFLILYLEKGFFFPLFLHIHMLKLVWWLGSTILNSYIHPLFKKIFLFISALLTGLPVKYGRVFLVPCKKWLVQCMLLYICTSASHFLYRVPEKHGHV